MRTKIIVPMVALAVAPALCIGTFMILKAREALEQSVVRRVEFDTVSKARAVEEFLFTVQQDIGFLSQTKSIRDLMSVETTAMEQLAATQRDAQRDFFLFFQSRHAYCQAQCVSNTGYDLIRLDAKNDALQIAPLQQLQNQSDKFYVQAGTALKLGQIYISPVHMDMVHGMRGAVVHYVTPVAGEGQRLRGLLVVGICVNHILAHLGSLPAGMEAWLLDEAGNYLGYIGESREKRAFYCLEKQRQLSDDLGPREISALLSNQGRRRPVELAGALLFSAPIAIGGATPGPHWTLIIAHPRAPIVAPVQRLTVFLSVVMVLLTIITGVLGALIAHYLGRPVASLQRATREIAAGNLSKRVQITTGDEIEELANDFNTMTKRLREAQEQLSAWNVELAREVEVQTEKIRQLQSGLARADKLATIGQITAGVMHEIGNPLAAIKTKIQVAEENPDLRKEERAFLGEILVEVDRLAIFLHSFSRFARLQEHRLQDHVSLTEVTDSVSRLLAPDLRRRHVILRFESAADAPRIRGDADQLRQVIMNLILNASDASPYGGNVTLRIRSTGGQVILEVIDQGTGIAPVILDKIGNPFFTTKPEGTGLGLAISRQIIQEHGGSIQIRSEVGKGTTVTATFPEQPS